MLIEKPAGVHTKHVREMIAAADATDRLFGIMLNLRPFPSSRRVKALVENDLGAIDRRCWMLTTFYRPDSYFRASSWRGTWGGEGGGVLLNQCPHALDLWQWWFGMPSRIRAFCQFGRHHDVEVEDDVTAYMEYADGSTGTFLASTGESPGSNELTIAADRGKLVLRDETLTYWRNRVGVRQFNAEYTGGFGQPECERIDMPLAEQIGQQHVVVFDAFVRAVRTGDASAMVANGREGLASLQLANAMLLSSWTDDWVALPFDDDLYYDLLQERVARSRFRGQATQNKVLDPAGSYMVGR